MKHGGDINNVKFVKLSITGSKLKNILGANLLICDNVHCILLSEKYIDPECVRNVK